MRYLMIIIVVCFFSDSEWLTDFDAAKEEARAKNRVILLNFAGSDWCAPCIKMKKEVFDNNEFVEYASAHLVLVRADFPRQKKNQLDARLKAHNEKLAEQYNPKGKFPLTLLLDAEGHVLHEWDGYQGMAVSDFIKQVNGKIHGK